MKAQRDIQEIQWHMQVTFFQLPHKNGSIGAMFRNLSILGS
jgi:hypothetical protein